MASDLDDQHAGDGLRETGEPHLLVELAPVIVFAISAPFAGVDAGRQALEVVLDVAAGQSQDALLDAHGAVVVEAGIEGRDPRSRRFDEQPGIVEPDALLVDTDTAEDA